MARRGRRRSSRERARRGRAAGDVGGPRVARARPEAGQTSVRATADGAVRGQRAQAHRRLPGSGAPGEARLRPGDARQVRRALEGRAGGARKIRRPVPRQCDHDHEQDHRGHDEGADDPARAAPGGDRRGALPPTRERERLKTDQRDARRARPPVPRQEEQRERGDDRERRRCDLNAPARSDEVTAQAGDRDDHADEERRRDRDIGDDRVGDRRGCEKAQTGDDERKPQRSHRSCVPGGAVTRPRLCSGNAPSREGYPGGLREL